MRNSLVAGSEYSITKSGFIAVRFKVKTGIVHLKVNDIVVASWYSVVSVENADFGTHIIPVAAYDKVTLTSSSAEAPSSDSEIYFYPMKATGPSLELLEIIYPVGSLYIGMMSECPFARIFGTWEKIEGRYLLASGQLVGGATDAEKFSVQSNPADAPTLVAPGLPNITGQGGDYFSNVATNSLSGALYQLPESHREDLVVGTNEESKTEVDAAFGFDASKSNAQYGTSSTVRPSAFVVNVWRRKA